MKEAEPSHPVVVSSSEPRDAVKTLWFWFEELRWKQPKCRWTEVSSEPSVWAAADENSSDSRDTRDFKGEKMLKNEVWTLWENVSILWDKNLITWRKRCKNLSVSRWRSFKNDLKFFFLMISDAAKWWNFAMMCEFYNWMFGGSLVSCKHENTVSCCVWSEWWWL